MRTGTAPYKRMPCGAVVGSRLGCCWNFGSRLPAALGVALALGALACGQLEVERPRAERSEASSKIAIVPSPDVSVGPDAAPRVRVALEKSDGTRVELPAEYLDAREFRRGAVALTPERELLVVHPDGSRSLLAREAEGPPAVASDGSLVYSARSGDVVEIHWLTPEGKDERLASFRGSATRLLPLDDRTIVFVGASVGGVVGLWLASREGAHCVTNCALRAGRTWGDAFTALPTDLSRVRLSGSRIEWQAADGSWTSEQVRSK